MFDSHPDYQRISTKKDSKSLPLTKQENTKMSKASELIEQLSQYVEKPAQPVPEEADKTPGDEVEDLEINVVDEDKDTFHGLLNNFCNRYDPENKMTIKECVNQAFEDEPKAVDIFVNQLLQLEYREPEDFRNTKV